MWFTLVKSLKSLRSCRKNQRQRLRVSIPCLFAFLHDSVNQASGNSVVCMKSHCDRAFICAKETSSQDEEVRIINVFQTHSPSMASYDKASQGRKYYLLVISFSPDNTTCTCNFCKDKMRKGLSERFHQFARFPYKVLRRNVFQKMHQMTSFDGERSMI